MSIPTELFTVETMTTLTGAIGAVCVITNGSQLAFNYNPKWFGLLIAQIISIVGVLSVNGPTLSNILVSFVNGFLIYSSAAGVTSIGSRVTQVNSDTTRSPASNLHSNYPTKRKFLTPWF